MPFVPILVAAGIYLVWRGLSQHRGPLLDAHLPKDTEDAVIVAASHEANPSRLRAFAASLLPHFPSAASVLLARAVKVEREPAVSAGGWNLFHAVKTAAKDATKVGPLAFVPGAGAAVVLATGVAALGHTKAGKDAANKMSQSPAFRKYVQPIVHGYEAGYMQANPAYFARSLVAGAANEALHGKRLDQAILDQHKQVSDWLSTKAHYAASAEGVPPAVTPALTASANVAAGQPIPQNIVSVASQTVGQVAGPAASDALEQGADAAEQVAQGSQTLQDVAAARQNLPPSAQPMFDNGLTLRTAQHLQAKGFGAAQDLMSGHPAHKAARALRDDRVLTTSIQNTRRALPPGAANMAQKAASTIVAHPELANLPATALARQLGVPEAIARAVLASVTIVPGGAPVVHARRLEAIVGRPSPPSPNPQAAMWARHYAPSDPGY
jgi:hypothetical protein